MKISVVAKVAATGLFVLLTLVACSASSPTTSDGSLCSVAEASTCSDPTPCDSNVTAACGALERVLTDVTVKAARDCLQSGVCGVASCLSRSAKSAIPTASHKTLAKDYCATCAASVADCEATFYARGQKLPGVLVLPYAAAVIDEIDSSCTGSAGCEAKFIVCANDVVARTVGEYLDAGTAACVIAAYKTDDGGGGLGGAPEVLTCTAENCQGCCRNDECEDGAALTGCGRAGAACQICAGAQLCTSNGVCKQPCGPDTCKGCCDGDTCLEGSSNNACGASGIACSTCTGVFVCSGNTCLDSSCQATCNGCCTVTGCQPGSGARACGFDGHACIDCGFGRRCTAAASCELDTTSLWDFYVSFGVVPSTNKRGSAWDAFAGFPDVYMNIFTSEGSRSHSGKTTTKLDSTVPFWQETPLKSIKASELLANTSLELWDSDNIFDDFIGGCSLPLTAALFDGSLQKYTCAASPSGVSVEIYYRINPHK